MIIDSLSAPTTKAPSLPSPSEPIIQKSTPDTSRKAVESAAPPPAPSLAAVQAAAHQLEQFLQSIGRTIEFRVDTATRMTVVTVKDTSTGDVIRQMPSDETLWLAEHLDGKQISALLNVKA